MNPFDKPFGKLRAPLRAGRIGPIGWIFLAALFFTIAAIEANDINPGYSFSPGEKNVDHVKLNELVGSASINPSFISTQPDGQPASGDLFVFYQQTSGQFRRTTLSTLSLANTNLIASQVEDSSPATNDYILTYDASANALKKVAIYNEFPLTGFVELTNAPDQQYQLFITSNGVPFRVSITNLFQTWWRFMQFANPTNAAGTDPTNALLSAHTHPTNSDELLIWDAHAQTNKYTTLAGLATNVPSVTVLTNTDTIGIFSTATNLPSGPNQFGTNPIVAKATLSTIGQWVSNNFVPPTPSKATVFQGPLGANVGLLVNTNHGLGGTPQIVRWVLVQTNTVADQGWGQNREVDITSFSLSDGTPAYATEADTSVLILVARNNVGNIQVRSAADGTLGNIATNSWNWRCYSVRLP